MKNNVLVMISTYNGEKYIQELLESVLSQKDVSLEILIRDDGSTDNTVNILKKYMKKYDNISLELGKNIGYAKSFWQLLKSSKNSYDYYAFCDQDDIWMKDKIKNAIYLIEKNKKYNYNVPVLYTSDVISIDNSKKIISKQTFMNKVLSKYESFQKSILPGCTFVFNKAAKIQASKYNGFMESHDWAMYTIINIFGQVIFDKESYIYYRIHDENAIGKENKIKNIINKVKYFCKPSKCTRSNFAKDFYECYKDELPYEIKINIKNLAFYKEKRNYKLKIIFGNVYKGFIFKLYILLNRV